MALMERRPRVTRVGENTQGVFSDVLDRRLPNGWRLTQILNTKADQIDATDLQAILVRFLQPARLIAIFQIQDADDAGGNPVGIAECRRAVAEADELLAQANYEASLQVYRNAWHHAQQIAEAALALQR